MRHSMLLVCTLAGFIFAISLTCFGQPADSTVIGHWQGVLDAGNAKLTVIFNITRDSSGTLSGTMDSPDQGAVGLRLSEVKMTGDSVLFGLKLIGGSFEGKASGDQASLVGQWKQSGMSFPLTLNRTEAKAELNRPQEPKPPFPYKSEEVTYENTAQGVKLAGTLTLPSTGGPFPAAVMITGSGPENRNEELFGHKPFLVIADYLTRRGIAVLRFDDRGVGGSTGDASLATSSDFATDVQAGIDFLKNRSDIDPKHIGLIGHSEGGLIGPMVAAKSKDAAFVVMLAGTGVPGKRILLEQTRLLMLADSTPAAKVDQEVAQFSRVVDIISSGKDSADVATRLRDHLRATESVWGAEAKAQGADLEQIIDGQIKQLDSRWFRQFVNYDPRPTLQKVKCPVLALGGSLDLQVPAEENLKEIGAALKKGGNKDYTTRLLPGLNHLFQHARTGSSKEYGQIEETFAPEALQAMGDWITVRVK